MSVKNYSRLKSVLLALLIIPMSFLATAQTPDANNTLYVNSNVTGGNGSGDSWENAIPQLSDALKYARLQYNADNTVYDAQPLKIFVAKGTYKPLYNARDNYYTETGSATVGYTDKDNAFVMVKNVQVYGGFDPENGIDDLTDTRIFGANGSVLSAEVGYDHISGDEAYHVVISSGAVGSALLNGFTLRDAYSNYLASGYIQVFGYYPIFRGSGGAISCIFSSPTIENCIITKNLTSQAGGIFNYQTASPTIINCTFIDNGTTGNGGAIYNSTNSSPTIINCNFTDNGGENGGAIYNATNSNPIITNCSFTDNSSRSNGGGAIYNIASSPIITNSLFANNSARNSISVGIWEEKNGGAIYNETTSSPVLTNVTIADNLGANTVYSTGSGSTTFNNSIVFGTVSAAYTAQNSLIEGNTDFTNGNINMTGITVSDVFTDNTNGDYTLKSTSPVIDMGNNSLNSTTTDLAGNARIYNSGTIDLGAYESEYTPFALTPDANGIIYVREGFTGNGSDWDNATGDFQGAINGTNVQKVFVEIGNYNVGNASFIMKNNVEIYGGFDPDNGIDDLSDTRILPNETAFEGSVLNGENQRPVIWNFNNGLNNTAVLDGFTLKNGYNNANAGGIMTVNCSPTYRNLVIKDNTAQKGGGMYSHNASPVISNVILKDNTATEDGGGIFNNQNSNAVMTNVTFQNNTADWGGGMFNNGSSPTMTAVEVTGNTANNEGGGMFNDQNSNPVMTNVTIDSNTAVYGGGILNRLSSPTMTDIEVTGNSVTNDGGGMYNQDNSSPLMTNMKFQNNTASYGGGMLNDNSSPTMNNIEIIDNIATIDGGGIYNYISSNPAMTNVKITGNTGIYGGGMFNDDNSSPVMTNVLIADNTATTNGGAIYNLNSSSPVLINTTIANNTAPKAVYNDNSTTSVKNSIVFGGIEGSFTAEYSMIQDSSSTDNGNIDMTGITANDVLNGDYSLNVTSVAVNAGNNVFNSTSTDLAGNTRIIGTAIDLGAYEMQCGAINTTDTRSECAPFTWIDGNEYSADNTTATHILQSVATGCDSIVTLNLTIIPTLHSTDVRSECAPFTWIDGNVYSVDNTTATYTLQSVVSGCDSVVNLNLTIVTIDTTVSLSSSTLTANQVGADYQWINCDSNAPVSGETGQTYTATVNGNYAVEITVNNCTETSVCIAVGSVGIETLKLSDWKIYPNPVNDKLFIESGEEMEIEIMDALGNVLISNTFYTNQNTIDVSRFASGVYFLKETNIGVTKKFVKK